MLMHSCSCESHLSIQTNFLPQSRPIISDDSVSHYPIRIRDGADRTALDYAKEFGAPQWAKKLLMNP